MVAFQQRECEKNRESRQAWELPGMDCELLSVFTDEYAPDSVMTVSERLSPFRRCCPFLYLQN